jgi:hypothetical protein
LLVLQTFLDSKDKFAASVAGIETPTIKKSETAIVRKPSLKKFFVLVIFFTAFLAADYYIFQSNLLTETGLRFRKIKH